MERNFQQEYRLEQERLNAIKAMEQQNVEMKIKITEYANKMQIGEKKIETLTVYIKKIQDEQAAKKNQAIRSDAEYQKQQNIIQDLQQKNRELELHYQAQARDYQRKISEYKQKLARSEAIIAVCNTQIQKQRIDLDVVIQQQKYKYVRLQQQMEELLKKNKDKEKQEAKSKISGSYSPSEQMQKLQKKSLDLIKQNEILIEELNAAQEKCLQLKKELRAVKLQNSKRG